MDDIDALVAELEEFTTDLGNVTTTTLQDLANQLPNQIISGLEDAGKNLNRPNSKGLRGSIEASVRGTQLEIGMNYYGYYQIFGVKGSGVSVLGLPASVAMTFEGKQQGDIFSFKSNRRGIAPAPNAAYPIINLADLIAQTIANQI